MAFLLQPTASSNNYFRPEWNMATGTAIPKMPLRKKNQLFATQGQNGTLSQFFPPRAD